MLGVTGARSVTTPIRSSCRATPVALVGTALCDGRTHDILPARFMTLNEVVVIQQPLMRSTWFCWRRRGFRDKSLSRILDSIL
jgi:hypothetical protein